MLHWSRGSAGLTTTTRFPPPQVFPGGLRHIRPDRRINEWRAPSRRTIVRATSNERQVVIALSGGEVLYFELNAQVGSVFRWFLCWAGGWKRGCGVCVGMGADPTAQPRQSRAVPAASNPTLCLLCFGSRAC